MANVAAVLPPSTSAVNGKYRTNPLTKPVEKDRHTVKTVQSENKLAYEIEIIWFNVALLTFIHVSGLYGIYLWITERKLLLFIFSYAYASFAGIGITAGVHRLWSHRAYKARLPLRILLMLMQTAALQTPIYDWTRDHRVHHKYTDTDADPYNATRGFFFSHVGWLMVKKHPEVTNRGQGIDMSDILDDPVVAFQSKYYWMLGPLLAFVIPIFIPVYFWNELLTVSFFHSMGRYVLNLNFTWLVNSAAHMWGSRPYDNRKSPTENMVVSILAYGEGWHNYHHVYPWDYKAAELGNYRANAATAFIDFFALFGLAYDLKYATPDMVRRHVKKYGDGHYLEARRPSDTK